VAESLDVHRAAPGEVSDPLEALARASGLVRAAIVRLALGTHERRVARRAGLRHVPAARALLALRRDRPDNLRDHVPGAPNDHGVPLSDILAMDLVLVVQRRVGHSDAADEHGFKNRE